MVVDPSQTEFDTVGIIGFGDVGTAFTEAFLDRGVDVVVTTRTANEQRHRPDRPLVVSDPGAVATQSDFVISCVWPDVAVDVAELTAAELGQDTVYLDVNSIGPAAVNEIEGIVTSHHGVFVNASIMDSVTRAGTNVPIAVGGDIPPHLCTELESIGMEIIHLWDDPVKPAVLKLCRSTFTKGVMTLAVEALLPAHAYGLSDDVLESVDRSFQRYSVGEFARYFLVDMFQNADRRSSEMGEVISMTSEVGLNLPLTKEVARFHRLLADMEMDPCDYEDALRALESEYRQRV